jgi:hypothetical protein
MEGNLAPRETFMFRTLPYVDLVRRWAKVCIIGVLLSLALPVAINAQPQRARPNLRVLFIGNSYTFTNNLGDVVAGIAESQKDGPTVTPTLVARAGMHLEWHLKNGPAMSLLQAGGWDYVILQEFSTLGGEIGKPEVGDPEPFYASVRQFVPKILAAGAKPVLLMTWARRGAPDSEAKKIFDAYEHIGGELDVKVAPAGVAWAEAHRRLRTLDLHIYDASHPTEAGSYLTGLVIYATLTGHNPRGAPATIFGHPVDTGGITAVPDTTLTVPLVELGPATAAELQRVAWDAVSRQIAAPLAQPSSSP